MTQKSRTCKMCKKTYELAIQDDIDTRMIQEQFPNREPWEREQLISGICSDECWEKINYGCTCETCLTFQSTMQGMCKPGERMLSSWDVSQNKALDH